MGESVRNLGFRARPALLLVCMLAAMAFDALSCEGLARIDFFITPTNRVLVNEVNTMPGFTPTSVFPQAWAASGIDYPALPQKRLTVRGITPSRD